MNFALKERAVSNALIKPEWKIKVRQIECPKITTFMDKFKNYQAAKDFSLLGKCYIFRNKIVKMCEYRFINCLFTAPHYAVQYFTERTGYIRSFGFDDSIELNKYTIGQKYAIAFKRSRGVCGVRCVGSRNNLIFTIKFVFLDYILVVFL